MDLLEGQVESVHGHLYALVAKDEYSQNLWIRFLKKKSEATDHLKTLIVAVENLHGWGTQVIQTDGESTLGRILADEEASNAPFYQFCQEKGIRKQVSAPGDPQSNGVAENGVKYLKGKSRTLLTAADAPQNLWTFSMAYAARVHNLLPKTKTLNKGHDGGPTTPHWLLTGQVPDVSNEHAWFSECWAHVKDRDQVEDERAVRANFLGRARNTKGFLVRDVESRRIFVARTVIFNERFTSRTPGTFAEIDKAGRTIELRPGNVIRKPAPIPTNKPSWWDSTMPDGAMRAWPPAQEAWELGNRAFEWALREGFETRVETTDPEPVKVPRRSTRAGAGTRRLREDSSLYDEWVEAHRRSDAIREPEILDAPTEHAPELDPDLDESEMALLGFDPFGMDFCFSNLSLEDDDSLGIPLYPAMAAPHRIFPSPSGRDFSLFPACDLPLDLRP